MKPNGAEYGSLDVLDPDEASEDEKSSAFTHARASSCSNCLCWGGHRGCAYRTVVTMVVVLFSVVVLLEPVLVSDCPEAPFNGEGNPWLHTNSLSWSECRHERLLTLLWLSRSECDFARRMLAAVVGGSFIGFERRMAGHEAGIRTLSLVSLGSCIFCLCSVHGFQGGNMEWDASRVAAAIPSGVGFLGAGVIWKGAQGDNGKGEKTWTTVHGLTTAASIWLSAAIGLSAGGALYFVVLFGSCAVVCIMRLIPRRPADVPPPKRQ